MKNFRFLAMIATLATYFLIFLGGLVRVSGAGLGCPDWPKCFGRWIPPFSTNQLPSNIDPSMFNFTLAWIEYINRLAGMIVGLLIAAVAIWAIIKYFRVTRIVVPSVLAALLVAYQGWQGGQLVASRLEPFLVSFHMFIAFLIAGLMIYITQQSYYIDVRGTEAEASYPKKLKIWTGLIWILALIQIMMGTQLREAVEVAVRNSPILNNGSALATIGAIKFAHPAIGAALALAALVIALWALFKSVKPSSLVWQSSWTLIGLAVIQLLIGVVMLFAGLPQVTQVLHLWAAALMFGVLSIMYLALRHKQEA